MKMKFKKILPVLLFTIISFSSLFSQTLQDQASAILANGKAEVDVNKRIDLFTQAINLNQSVPEANYMRGFELYKLGRHAEAINDFTAAITMYPNYPDAFLYRGLAQYSLRNYQAAYYDFAETNRLRPTYPYGFYYKGMSAYYIGWAELAVEDFTKAVSLKPDYSQAYYQLGMAYYISNNLKKDSLGLLAYSKAIALNPNSAETYYGRSCIYLGLMKYDLMLADADKAVTLKPDYIDALLQRAFAKNALNGFKGNNGSEDIAKALELKPNCGACYQKRLDLYQYQSDNTYSEQVIADAKKMIELKYEVESAYIALGNQYYNKGKYQEALNNYNEALKISVYRSKYLNDQIAKTKEKLAGK
jgi:tetratricopeptide (TPR) repeat protein